MELNFKSKQCASCRRHLPADLLTFAKARFELSGLGSYCKACNAEKNYFKRLSKYGPATAPRREKKSTLQIDQQNRLQLIRLIANQPSKAFLLDLSNNQVHTLNILKPSNTDIKFDFNESVWNVSSPSVDATIQKLITMLKANAYRIEESESSLKLFQYEYMSHMGTK